MRASDKQTTNRNLQYKFIPATKFYPSCISEDIGCWYSSKMDWLFKSERDLGCGVGRNLDDDVK